MKYIETLDPINGRYKKGDWVDINGKTYELKVDVGNSCHWEIPFRLIRDTESLLNETNVFRANGLESIQDKINEKLLNNDEKTTMTDELKPASEMGFFEICAAVERGEEFECHGYALYIDGGTVEIKNYNQSFLYSYHKEGSITRAKPWYEKLDGTEENGVWCKVWDESAEKTTIDKINAYNEDIKHMFESIYAMWKNATPLPKELADILEKECNND